MKQAASPLASRGELQRATERERFLEPRQGSHKQKKGLFQVRSSSSGDKRVLVCGLRHFPLGDKEPCDGLPYWCQPENS